MKHPYVKLGMETLGIDRYYHGQILHILRSNVNEGFWDREIRFLTSLGIPCYGKRKMEVLGWLNEVGHKTYCHFRYSDIRAFDKAVNRIKKYYYGKVI